ncbi:glycerophosphocholine phosphodiesterase GPCPD1-like isoform X2 [Eupeodes corollae]|uniref:glycerophosphocholine phosphodiesterase GPCPD1-like isoform X2 n=1 Tax=Eupeodes corollae TaxID=290404 RepID=UPI0024912542|nr:glycerophosphocholine phosphodiesterase GPCPD1-like isoform X2 [Eupeodes corollae]
MSVSMVLSVLDSTSPATVIDEHSEHCNAVTNNVIQRAGEPTVITSPTEQCLPSPRTFTVQLDAILAPDEYVGLTGDSFELGAWDPLRSVQLSEVAANIWTGIVNLCSPGKVQYRYFVYSLDSLGHIQIKRWESYVEPRNIRTCNHGCMRMDQFGKIEDQQQISRGWLTNETVIQLKFLNRVFSFEGQTPEKMYLKIVPVEEGAVLPNYNESLSNVEAVNMKYGRSVLERQSDLGVMYEGGDIVVFQLTISGGQDNDTYALVLHSEDREPLGHALISAASMPEDDGYINLKIVSPDGSADVASAELPYVIIRPLHGGKLNFRTSYAHTWQPQWENLLVGHCGAGLSFIPNGAPVPENTIASYKQAYASNVDMIELDVHLTKDYVPVVYHDFEIYTAPIGAEPKSKEDLTKIFLKDITYNELKEVRIFSVAGGKIKEYPSHNSEEREDYRLFPTLEQVFQQLPLGLAINVEIKWPQLLFDGSLEADQMLDKNLFVDLILLTALRNGCGRMIIFSCFDADVCTMVRMKQNIFPVIFLTLGCTDKWPAYADPRCKDIETASSNCQAFQLIGVAVHAEDILRDPSMTRLATDLGQKVFLWGDDINSFERVQLFEAAGVTANIFDRADLIVPKDKTNNIFRTAETIEYFRGQCSPSP